MKYIKVPRGPVIFFTLNGTTTYRRLYLYCWSQAIIDREQELIKDMVPRDRCLGEETVEFMAVKISTYPRSQPQKRLIGIMRPPKTAPTWWRRDGSGRGRPNCKGKPPRPSCWQTLQILASPALEACVNLCQWAINAENSNLASHGVPRESTPMSHQRCCNQHHRGKEVRGNIYSLDQRRHHHQWSVAAWPY